MSYICIYCYGVTIRQNCILAVLTVGKHSGNKVTVRIPNRYVTDNFAWIFSRNNEGTEWLQGVYYAGWIMEAGKCWGRF